MCTPYGMVPPAPAGDPPPSRLRPVIGRGICPSCRRGYKARQGDEVGRLLHECDTSRIELDGVAGACTIHAVKPAPLRDRKRPR